MRACMQVTCAHQLAFDDGVQRSADDVSGSTPVLDDDEEIYVTQLLLVMVFFENGQVRSRDACLHACVHACSARALTSLR